MPEFMCTRCDSPLGDFEDEPTVTLRGQQYHSLCGLSVCASLLNIQSMSLEDYRECLDILGLSMEVASRRYEKAAADARRDELVSVARNLMGSLKGDMP